MFPHPRERREGAEEGTATARSAGQDGPVLANTGATDSAVITARAGERLSLVEVLVAELGAWTGAIVCRCHLPVGPFLASDGAVHLDLAAFGSEPGERAESSAPE